MKRQLYSVISEVRIPEEPRYDPKSDIYVADGWRDPLTTVLMMWPNGFPCIEINLYLMSLVENLRVDSTGGSLKEIASQLSHIVRFCWEHDGIRRNFWDLDSASYETFLRKLQFEEHKYHIGERARQGNRIREISLVTLTFLEWLQDHVLVERKLVGLSSEGYRIGLVWVQENNRYGGKSYKKRFPFKIPVSARDPKPPMAMESIQRLREVVREKYDINNLHPNYIAQFENRDELSITVEFFFRRRECMLHILQHSGSRPYELELCSYKKNLDPTISKKLVMPTVKREEGFVRELPIQFATSVIIELYIDCRYRYLQFLKIKGANPNPGDALFINEKGAGMSRRALTTEFKRLCARAGLVSRQCLSMLRHRFITLAVAVELKQVIKDDPSFPVHSRLFADYRTILTRVAKLTGHTNPESLMPYIHLAWDELHLFGGADDLRELVMVIEEVRALRKVYASDTSATVGETSQELDGKLRLFDAMMQVLTESVEKLVARQQPGLEARTVRLS
ncbi:hypothetical protein CIC12_12900 [Burkholderia sp. SG-MS1]|uniref:phage integrase family protein n=1 Tax=Paraburkholderia sp. SG-MS1 TaxID=2023741 RepID=UPI00144709E2|nr:phage integrase family protein [Paraburkholderia sp. SG-MS1]NKJ47624.1 hypothetical protein [Paraburkholderia sp. SG-MS1]